MIIINLCDVGAIIEPDTSAPLTFDADGESQTKDAYDFGYTNTAACPDTVITYSLVEDGTETLPSYLSFNGVSN